MAFTGVLALSSVCDIRCDIFVGLRAIELSGLAVAEESLCAGFGC